MTDAARVSRDGGAAAHGGEGELLARRIARLLSTHPERDWRLDDLGDEVHLSISQIGRVFTRQFGISPMRYLARLRAHRLARLLADTDLPVGAAMREVGWRSRGHAARQFAAVMGMPPSAYRAACRRRAGGTAAG